MRDTSEGERVGGLEGATEGVVTCVIVLKADAPSASSMLALGMGGRGNGKSLCDGARYGINSLGLT